jgi:phospholipid/cholesterol/gamma-HCH transport system substrate-binding protein
VRAIRKHLRDFVAMLVLGGVASVVALYVLDNQRLRFPFIEPEPFVVQAAFSTAQAVTPGQGQTVQVSGVEIGQIGPVRLQDGRAVLRLEIEPRHRRLIRQDAVALLRPRTGLKDMYVQLHPGSPTAPPARPGWTIPIRNTLPDVNLDEILASLDADTRGYVQLLVNGTGRGLRGRGGDLAEVFRRFEPTARDLGRVSRAVARERVALRRLVASLAALNGELASGEHPRDLTELVDASATTFRAFASEGSGLRASVHELGPSLRQLSRTLITVRGFAGELGPTSRALLPAVRRLDDANLAVRPFAAQATPVVRDQIRPFVREAQPLLSDLRPGARELADATPDLERSFVVLNHLFNMLGYNRDGREGPDRAGRDEGHLFWIAWVTHDTVNLFNVDDANGPLRPIFLTGTCTTLVNLTALDPLAEFALNLSPILTTLCGDPLTQSIDTRAARRDLAAAERETGRRAPGAGERERKDEERPADADDHPADALPDAVERVLPGGGG